MFAENLKGLFFNAIHSFQRQVINRRTGYFIRNPGGEQFLWFLKNDLLQFKFVFDSRKRFFIDMFGKEYYS